ncbi:hypothetical protein [Halohasta litorea]|nr:hypothetical protein [Halohasta litorea]
MTDDSPETTFTLNVRHEGYHADQFTPHTQINRFYLVGSGTPSAEQLVEAYLHAIADAVIYDKHSLSDALLSGIIADSGNPLDIEVVDKETYTEHEAAETFDLYIWDYREATLERGRSHVPAITDPTKEELIDAAQTLDEEHERPTTASDSQEPLDGFDTSDADLDFA